MEATLKSMGRRELCSVGPAYRNGKECSMRREKARGEALARFCSRYDATQPGLNDLERKVRLRSLLQLDLSDIDDMRRSMAEGWIARLRATDPDLVREMERRLGGADGINRRKDPFPFPLLPA